MVFTQIISNFVSWFWVIKVAYKKKVYPEIYTPNYFCILVTIIIVYTLKDKCKYVIITIFSNKLTCLVIIKSLFSL